MFKNNIVRSTINLTRKLIISIITFSLIACSSSNDKESNVTIKLDDWKLSIPTDDDGNKRSDTIQTEQLINGYTDNLYFYESADAGLVFKSPSHGYKTSENTKYIRSELREMLRRYDTNIETKGVNKNNWVFSSAPVSDQLAAGGVDGVLQAEVAVNKVTETGKTSQIGRVIIGQIHANDDEPIRLYYRKLPHHEKGSIYYAHEPLNQKDIYVNLIGSRASDAEEPLDGVALNERFSYKIEVIANTLKVEIMREGKETITSIFDMSDSGYDQGGQYMYFKAGVYNQNNTSELSDYVQATFYTIKNSHNGYLYSE